MTVYLDGKNRLNNEYTMRKHLLVSHGFLGDNLFISSVAKKLLEENRCEQVEFFTGFPQVAELLLENPYIHAVHVSPTVGPELKHIITNYDLSEFEQVFTFVPFSFKIPPAIEAQLKCNITNTSAEFQVWTNKINDDVAIERINKLRALHPNKKVVGWMRNWEQKAFQFTENEYWTAPNHPLTGYGKRNRNISFIINELSKQFIMVPIGVPDTMTQFDTATRLHEYNTFSQDASLLKYCDYFIGTEGGLANLAAAVNCKTILTYEFIWQCYGPRGTVRPFKNGPALGPVHYFDHGHVYLPLYKTDQELIELITNEIEKDTN